MTLDDCAKILADGLTLQVKRGLVKDYVQGTAVESAIRGRMDVSTSLRDRTLYKQRMVCIYEDYTENCPLNRIVKAGAKLLISCPDISEENRKRLQDLMIYFSTVDNISLRRMSWRINYGKNGPAY
ncbi:MAG: 5-methylcytosine-specific restriction endonuclease system specificity protein McrC, partial [Lachnospiraceae bacterium]|nr:5-methylcytosine-specific restriction endonuclease system specificity protein McrC [Lachnospiraceae bacterium]